MTGPATSDDRRCRARQGRALTPGATGVRRGASCAVVALLVGLSVASFQKRFTPVVPVTLMTDRIGSQLQTALGREDARPDRRRGALDPRRPVTARASSWPCSPSRLGSIPANVRARLLPKTLFGERYVDLVSPDAGRRGRTIAEGDVIAQDRSSVAIELEQVFADLLPLLRAVQPGRLAAHAERDGDRAGGSGRAARREPGAGRCVLHRRSTRSCRRSQTDISRAGGRGARRTPTRRPTCCTAAHNLADDEHARSCRSRTRWPASCAGTAGFANDGRGFLEANGDRIIQVGQVSRPTLDVLAKYSPEYPCLAAALADWISPDRPGARGTTRFHITLEVAQQRPGYQPGEEPRWGETAAPTAAACPARPAARPTRARATRFTTAPAAAGPAPGSALPQPVAGHVRRGGRRRGPGSPAPRRSSAWSPPCCPQAPRTPRPSPPCSPARWCAGRW